MSHMELTYPCVVQHRIVELTADEMAALEWRLLPIADKVDALLQRIVILETRNADLEAKLAQLPAASR